MPEPDPNAPTNKDGADPSKDANQPSEREKELESQLAKAEEEKLNLRKGLDEKGVELNQAKQKLAEKADDVISGKISATELTEQEKEDLGYMSKLGFVPQSKLDEVMKKVDETVAKVKEETTKEVEEKLTKKEKLAQVKQEIATLKNQYSFIDESELEKYMSERAIGGTILSAEEAVTLLYKDKILASGIKPADLPGAEKGGKQGIEEPKPKILPLGSREMGDRIAEKLVKVD